MRKEILEEINDNQERVNKQFSFIEKHSKELSRVEAGMEVVKEWFIGAEIDLNSISIDIKYSGDRHTLNGCFAALRSLGYIPNERPKGANLASFVTYWNRDPHKLGDLRIWFRFASTKCAVVKVGTKMVEQAVYETVCE